MKFATCCLTMGCHEILLSGCACRRPFLHYLFILTSSTRHYCLLVSKEEAKRPVAARKHSDFSVFGHLRAPVDPNCKLHIQVFPAMPCIYVFRLIFQNIFYFIYRTRVLLLLLLGGGWHYPNKPK